MKNRKPSSQNRAILEVLRRSTAHPTAPELYVQVRATLPSISLGTVYRNLKRMVQEALIQKLEFSGAPARYDGRTDPHCHVRCLGCGRVEDVALKPLPELQQAAAEASGYRDVELRVACDGICPYCASRNQGSAACEPAGKDTESTETDLPPSNAASGDGRSEAESSLRRTNLPATKEGG